MQQITHLLEYFRDFSGLRNLARRELDIHHMGNYSRSRTIAEKALRLQKYEGGGESPASYYHHIPYRQLRMDIFPDALDNGRMQGHRQNIHGFRDYPVFIKQQQYDLHARRRLHIVF